MINPKNVSMESVVAAKSVVGKLVEERCECAKLRAERDRLRSALEACVEELAFETWDTSHGLIAAKLALEAK